MEIHKVRTGCFLLPAVLLCALGSGEDPKGLVAQMLTTQAEHIPFLGSQRMQEKTTKAKYTHNVYK